MAGLQGGQSATPDSEKIIKNQEKSGKIQEKSRRKGKNREVSFTLPLLTDRAGYTTATRIVCLQTLPSNFQYSLMHNTSISPKKFTCHARGKHGAVDRASDSEYMNGCPAWVRARLVPQICVSFLCPWARHFTLIVPWFGGHVKPSVPCTCI